MGQLDSLQSRYEDTFAEAVSKVQRDYARQFLTQFRIMLRGFNLSRHDVTISSGMGSACLCINGETFDTWRVNGWGWNAAKGRFPVIDALYIIEESLAYEWADWLNDESLTQYATISEVKRKG